MKTKNINTRAAQDITIGELPKQDNPNNSDLVVIQGSSLTEATTIQQLRNKILSGGDSVDGGLGTYLFSPVPVTDTSYLLMDGTKYFKNSYQDFYLFLQNQSANAKTLFKLDEIEESFTLPDYTNLGMKVTKTTPTSTTPTAGVAEHKHKIAGFGKRTGFWMNQQTGTQPSSARSVLVEEISGDQNVDRPYTGSPLDTLYNTALSTIRYPSFPSLCYIKVLNQNSNIVATPFIKSNGSVSMDIDYEPTDFMDVATKKYIDNKFLNYEVPLSFSINDIGKKIPYYSNAETNPTLIALDGTKYLISDYLDFDYTQTGFSNDGVYFWFANIELEIKLFQNEIQPSSEWAVIPFYNDRVKGHTLAGNFEFNSKMIYNFLNSPQGAEYLFDNDALGKNAKNNSGFTILDPVEYRIRANYNNWGIFSDSILPPNKNMYKFKINTTSVSADLKNQNNIFYIETSSGINPTTNVFFGATGELAYLKIKPDYMVAKIQQVGNPISGDLKSDRSVLLTGAGTFNTKQPTSMDDLKAENIIYSNVVAVKGAKVIITLKDKLDETDSVVADNKTNITANTSAIADNTTAIADHESRIVAVESNVNPVKTLYNRKFTKTTAGTIPAGQPIRLLDILTQTVATSFEPNNLTHIFTSGTNAKIQEKIVGNNKDGWLHFEIRFSRNAAFGNTTLEFQILRASDNSIVTADMLTNSTNNSRNFKMDLASTLYDVTDPYVTNGYYLVLINRAGTDFAYDTIELKITKFIDIGY